MALLWLGAVVTGLGALQYHSTKPGKVGSATPNREEFLAAQRTPGRSLLVMALHPRCPCSEASLGELSELIARQPGRCDVLLLYFQPEGDTTGWTLPRPEESLGVANARAMADPGGRMAASLGAITSGHVLLVDADGALKFNGGITPGRGHRGHADGQDAILASFTGQVCPISQAPVFGCPLTPECVGPVSSK